jgi:hypothetical protein
MQYMRHSRTGKIAVYDADLVETGRWELVGTAAAVEAKKPSANDAVAVQDEIQITVTRGKNESKQRKA